MIRILNVYYPTRTVLLLVSEVLLIAASFAASVIILQGSDAYITINYEHGLAKLIALTFIVVALLYYSNLYDNDLVADRWEISLRLLLVLGTGCLLVSALLYVFPDFAIGRNVFSLGFALVAVALLLWRRVYAWALAREQFREQICILGTGSYAESVRDHIAAHSDLGMKVVHCGSADPAAGEAVDATQQVQHLLNSSAPVQRVVVAMQDRRAKLPMSSLVELRFRGVVVEEAGDLLERISGRIQLDGLRPSNFLFGDGFRVKPSQQLTRRVLSTIAAGVGLLLFAPFFPVVVLLVRCSSKGPIFFSQLRVGEGGRVFRVHKFRTMRTDAEADGARWASRNDPRVTSIGMLLRKTRIDEVPQLWNVLRGEMGFVGPRPERPEFVPWLAENLPYYNLRHVIRPGLTGWAQVRYGYGATLEQSRVKLEHDLYYIKHMSLGLDLLIMFETVKTILHRRGAQ